jgi:hypothetical protein
MPKTAIVVWVVLGTATSLAAVCESRPVPNELPEALRWVLDQEKAADLARPAAARPAGLSLPTPLILSGLAAPVHAAVISVFEKRPLKPETAGVGSRRRTAQDAAVQIVKHLDEWEAETGPLAPAGRRWRKLNPDRQAAAIADDLERMVPDIGWWFLPNLFLEISAEVEISPVRLEPIIRSLIWTDAQNIPRAAAVREKDSGDVKTWFAARTTASEVALLSRLSIEGHSRFSAYAVCDTSR